MDALREGDAFGIPRGTRGIVSKPMVPLPLAQDIGSRWVYWPWVGDHLDEIRTRLAEHITLTFWAVFIGFLIPFPLALLAEP